MSTLRAIGKAVIAVCIISVSTAYHSSSVRNGWSGVGSLYRSALSIAASTNSVSDDSTILSSRRRWFGNALVVTATYVSPLLIRPAESAADEGDTIWQTGKPPKVPGQKPRDKNDVRGTRKDPNFLRSLADCKNQCENTSGPDGLSKPKEQCLSECQDICCTTYEQCTFGIVPRI
jgi:hypothetical protein